MKEVEGELAMLRATLTDIEGVMDSMAGELKQKNRELSTLEAVAMLLIVRSKPESYDEAMEDRESVKWELAMKDEMDFLMSNQT